MYIVANSIPLSPPLPPPPPPPPPRQGGIKCRMKWIGKKMQGRGKKTGENFREEKKGRERVKHQGKTLKEG